MPIEVDIEQGTRDWVEARLGIPTASEMSRIVTPTVRKESTTVHAIATEHTALGRAKREAGEAFCAKGFPSWISTPNEPIDCPECLGRLTSHIVPSFRNGRKVTHSGGLLSESRITYLGELLAEWWSGEPFHDFESELMARGTQLEEDAFNYYAFTRDAEPRKVGIVYKDEERMVAASPDALVGDDGGLECKCPRPDVHLVWLASGMPTKHIAQVQACLWVTGRQWWDFLSYCPGLPELLVRVEPDEKYQAALDEHVPAFIGEVLAARERLMGLGVIPWNSEA